DSALLQLLRRSRADVPEGRVLPRARADAARAAVRDRAARRARDLRRVRRARRKEIPADARVATPAVRSFRPASPGPGVASATPLGDRAFGGAAGAPPAPALACRGGNRHHPQSFERRQRSPSQQNVRRYIAGLAFSTAIGFGTMQTASAQHATAFDLEDA